MPLFYNKYLFNCDYFYKKNLKSVQSIIKLESLEFTVPLHNMVRDFQAFSSKKNDLDFQLSLFLLLYLGHNNIPYVSFVELKEKNDEYFLKFRFNKNKASYILFNFYSEVWHYLTNFKLNINNNNNFAFFTQLNLLNFCELNFCMKSMLGATNTKNFSVFINIRLK